MGAEQSRHGAWDEIRKIAERLDTPHADKVFVAKEYTKADLRRDLLATIPKAPEPYSYRPNAYGHTVAIAHPTLGNILVSPEDEAAWMAKLG